jgi:hypothetical protein
LNIDERAKFGLSNLSSTSIAKILIGFGIFLFPIMSMTVSHGVYITPFFLVLLAIYQGLIKTLVPFSIQANLPIRACYVVTAKKKYADDL